MGAQWLDGAVECGTLQETEARFSLVSAEVERALDEERVGVERGMDDLQRLSGKTTLELCLLRDHATRLGATLAALAPTACPEVVQSLAHLDSLRSTLEHINSTLQQQQHWANLDSLVTNLIASTQFDQAATLLAQATPHSPDHQALLLSLNNQLEAAVSTPLIHAITTNNLAQIVHFHQIFTKINRASQFKAYYFATRRTSLVVLNDLPFKQFLPKFYAQLHALVTDERAYIPAIFQDPANTLSALINTTLDSLDPSLPQRLNALQAQFGALVLPEIIHAYHATQDFAVMVERIMAILGYSEQLPPSRKDQRLSKRMSISKRSSRSMSFGAVGGPLAGEADAIRAWETALFEPFLDWQVDYPELERAYLAAEMVRETRGQEMLPNPSSRELERGVRRTLESEGGARVLWAHTVAIFGLAEDALGRTMSLTHGYAVAGVIRVIDGELVQFLEQRREELNKARQGSVRGRFGTGGGEDEGLELEGLEYSTEDWGTFQFGLRLLDTCRSISDKLSGFEIKLGTRLVGLAKEIKDVRADPLNHAIPGTTRGAVTLLRQSSLNSTELAALLDPLDSEHAPSPLPRHLPKARTATTEFTRATQLFLHDTILAPLKAHLQEYATLPAWSASGDRANPGRGAFDLSIPTFSLSPTETISKAGEGLFNLPRLFEVYADDDALAFSIATLPFVDEQLLRSTLTPVLPPASPSLSRHSHSRSTDILSQRKGSISLPVEPLPALSAEIVISTWLSSLVLSIISHLTSVVLPSIARLSRHGAAQLVSDLSYLSNVARALDVDSGETLDHWREAAEHDDEAARARVPQGGEADRIFELVARLRGWRIGVR